MQEGIDIKNRRKIEDIIDFLRRKRILIIDYSINLEEKSLRCLFDPTMFLNTNHLSFLIPIIIYMRDGYLFTGLVEVLVLDVDEEQTEELFLGLVDLG